MNHWNGPRLALITLLALAAILPAARSQEAIRKTQTLSDFTREADRARWNTWGGVRADAAAPGRFTFPQWKAGTDEWPAIRLPLRDGLPTNWSGLDVLVLEAHNPLAEAVDVALYIGDPESENTSRHFMLEPGDSAIRFPVYEMERVNVARLNEFRIFLTRPTVDTPFTFRSLRLEEDLDGRLATSENRLSWVRDGAAREGYPSLLAGVAAAGARLRAELANAKTVGAREALRPDIVAFEKATLQTARRAVSEVRMRRDWDRLHPLAPYALGFASSMEKIFPSDIPFSAHVAREGEISLAGNESEALQLLILAGPKGLEDVTVEVGPLTREDGGTDERFPAEGVRVAPVGFVETKTPPYRADYVGWHPDPILDFLKAFDVRPGEMQPVWIALKAPDGLRSGTYRGEVTVRPANGPTQTVGLRATVWGFDLPKETHLRTALSFRKEMIAQVYGRDDPEMVQRYEDFMLAYRMNPDNIYRTPSAAAAAAGGNPYLTVPPSMEDLLRWDKAGMNAFNILYVVKPKDLQAGAPYPPEQKRQILEMLDTVIPQYKAHGLYEKAYVYGFDEVHADSHNAMSDIFGAIRQKYPDLPILTTAYDATYGEASKLPMVDNWVPLTSAYHPDRVAKAREQGKDVWWYICVVPKAPYANILIEYPAIDGRVLMGLQTAKYQPGGFLYYAVNRWPLSKKPITDGPYTDWPTRSFWELNGDGSFMCAGPDGPLSTIRMENMTDGIEDNEYFWLLREEQKKLKGMTGPAAARALRQVDSALEIGDDLVKSLTEFTKSPEAVLARRRQAAEAIVAAQALTLPERTTSR